MFHIKEIEEKKKAVKKAAAKLDAALDAHEQVVERKKETSKHLTEVIEESCVLRKASISSCARKALVIDEEEREDSVEETGFLPALS